MALPNYIFITGFMGSGKTKFGKKLAAHLKYDHLDLDQWIEENDDIVSDEVRTLSSSGYDGDILDKMFKSARYYFRKKSTEKKEPVKRRKYCGLSKEVLDAMDKHIASNITNDDYKPSSGFESFCIMHSALLKNESTKLITNGFKDSDEIHEKLKKTYKNRYFMFISK